MELKLAAKAANPAGTCFTLGGAAGVTVGEDLVLIAGPCSVESEEQVGTIARAVKSAGANVLRGGAYKPRTSPYAFQGLGRRGLAYLQKAGKDAGLPVVSEVVDTRDVFLVCEYVDMLQIGARNMQNFALLKEAGRAGQPVMLKRGMHASIEEWLNSAEYILNEGNPNVLLCERGLRTTETYTRNTMDLSAVAAVRQLSHLPVICDPSHGTGRPELMEAMSLASLCAGAHGVMLEVHNAPEKALSDGEQALTPAQFEGISGKLQRLWAFNKML